MSNLRDLALKPRAIAALVILRTGPHSTGFIFNSIGDEDVNQTGKLLVLMKNGIDGSSRGCKLVQWMPTDSSGRVTWGLTHDGLGWLQSQGLDASESAKQAMYSAIDALA